MRKKITVLTSLVLTFVLAIVGVFSINYSNSGNNQLVRSVELNNNSLVDDSYFNAFDSYNLVVEDNKSTFDGFISINLSELAEIDNVASTDILNDASLKFSSTFDYDTGTSTLNVYVIDENDEVTIIDTIYGVAFKAEYGAASNYVENGEWHHIVEQNTVTKGINPAESVYNTKNTVAIPKNVHLEISKRYSTGFGSYSHYRDYINTLPYDEQYKIGLEILNEVCKKFGIAPIWM